MQVQSNKTEICMNAQEQRSLVRACTTAPRARLHNGASCAPAQRSLVRACTTEPRASLHNGASCEPGQEMDPRAVAEPHAQSDSRNYDSQPWPQNTVILTPPSSLHCSRTAG
ncbi:aldehyde oxidase-like [Platysternon megacephalum]|uniref:Aldehyde oxidase-like n=1 Tax=Platysternon megacephalum TaxID=55544 RepID=A0A4D9EZI4_9SAUR|nr:aldehyde oxidase-like [Platysternon megacephalum]